LVTFFGFIKDSGWLDTNPAKMIKKPKIDSPPTLPFDRDQMVAILKATDLYKDNYGNTGGPDSRRLRALAFLMRYSGLAIRDAVTLRRDQLLGDKLFIRRQKTGVPVNCKLPPFVVEALKECPGTNPEYFFWTGSSNPKSAVGNWQRAFRKLFTLAGIPDGHPHRFRDTFAVELLLAGTPIDRVAVILGHSSVKTTEKSYAPWVRARQEQLEADIVRTWANDPVVAAGIG